MSMYRSSASSTSVIELQPVHHQSQRASESSLPEELRTLPSHDSLRSRPSKDVNLNLPPPTTAVEAVQKWNHPRVNLYRTFATFFAFMVMGANDAAYGALIPYLETYYNLSYTVISLVFLFPIVGYVAAALTNNAIHLRFGQRGVAFAGPIAHLIAYVVIAVHPPYPVVIVIFILAGFGNGILDSGWNAWVGAMANANEVLGFLHGFYGLGATISPLIATTMITKGGLQWYTFYYIMIGAAVAEAIVSATAFWSATGIVFRAANPRTSDAKGGRLREALLQRPAARVTWLCAMFLFGYVGVEVGLGGWIVTFMMRVRQGGAFASGMTATGFWLGLTIGRVILGFVTPRIGEKLALSIYLLLSIALQLVFWLVPQFYVSAVAIGLIGFFIGPLFPGSVVVATKSLPRHLHVSAVGFASAFGGAGAAVFPFVVGAIAQSKGVQILQPFILALLVVILGLWLGLPRVAKRNE